MMKRAMMLVVVVLLANVAWADTFDAGGANQFTIDFVDISGDASSANGTNISQFSSDNPAYGTFYRTFSDPTNDYRMGTYEIANDQWNKFQNEYSTVTGSPSKAYDESSTWTGTDVPTNELSWYEAAQFVNYLNTSTGHQTAYKFTGTQGTDDYTFALWQPEDLGYNSNNPYRNSNAFYFLPTEDEWVKAAYWNGASLQTYATTDGSIPVAGVDTNYGHAVGNPWDIGSGSEELNGTFDMMGNIWEWTESLGNDGGYLSGSNRAIRGGSYYRFADGRTLSSSTRSSNDPDLEIYSAGFRVASVPEPCSLVLLSLGGLMLRRKLRR